MSLEIIPHVGFGLVKFGMTKDQVAGKLGKPNDIYEEKIDGTTEVVVDYEEIGVDLSFSSADNYRLGTMSFYAEDTLLCGEEFIGMTEEELIESAKAAGINDLELEDDFEDLDSKDYYSDEFGVSFWIQDGIVDSITVFPQYNAEDDDRVLWPE